MLFFQKRGSKLAQIDFKDLQAWIDKFSSPFFCIHKTFHPDIVFIGYSLRNFPNDRCDTSLNDSQVLCNAASFGELCGLKINRRLFDDLEEVKKYIGSKIVDAQLIIEIVNALASVVGYDYYKVPPIFNVFNMSRCVCFSIKDWDNLQRHNNPLCPFIRMFGYKEYEESGKAIMKLRIKKSDMQFLPETLKLLTK